MLLWSRTKVKSMPEFMPARIFVLTELLVVWYSCGEGDMIDTGRSDYFWSEFMFSCEFLS